MALTRLFSPFRILAGLHVSHRSRPIQADIRRCTRRKPGCSRHRTCRCPCWGRTVCTSQSSVKQPCCKMGESATRSMQSFESGAMFVFRESSQRSPKSGAASMVDVDWSRVKQQGNLGRGSPCPSMPRLVSWLPQDPKREAKRTAFGSKEKPVPSRLSPRKAARNDSVLTSGPKDNFERAGAPHFSSSASDSRDRKDHPNRTLLPAKLQAISDLTVQPSPGMAA